MDYGADNYYEHLKDTSPRKKDKRRHQQPLEEEFSSLSLAHVQGGQEGSVSMSLSKLSLTYCGVSNNSC